MSYGIKWTDRIADKFRDIRDRLNLNKESLAHIGMAAGIAVIISTVLLFTTAISRGAYNADISRLDVGITANAEGLGTILALGPLATADQFQYIISQVAAHTGGISSLDGRVGDAESRITAVEADLAEAICSPPEGYLTGAFGNYTLYVKSNKAGNFTANVHLVYSPPVGAGNATTYGEAMQAFYAGINWTAASATGYIPVITYNGTAWGVSQVWFSIGAFALAANNETAIDIIFAGLNSTYEPDFAYAEVFPVIKNK